MHKFIKIPVKYIKNNNIANRLCVHYTEVYIMHFYF